MDKVAVLIPCYNEAQTIRKVVEDFKRVLPDGGIIYVYDNNSTDDTDVLLRKLVLSCGVSISKERAMSSVFERRF